MGDPGAVGAAGGDGVFATVSSGFPAGSVCFTSYENVTAYNLMDILIGKRGDSEATVGVGRPVPVPEPAPISGMLLLAGVS